jgi:YesN/AraC family two-component response regulator
MMLQEISDLAGQHELIAENMCSEITNEINSLVRELKDERKRYLNEGQKLQCNLNHSYLQLDKSKKYYEKAFKEAERALEHYEKVDADLNLSRADVEKARLYSQTKNQVADQCKSDYATNLQKTNELQRSHFTEAMPRVFNHLQDMETRRITCSQNFIYQSAKIQIDVFPIVSFRHTDEFTENLKSGY